jgi:1-acyl-sn-glycerol-3-phosphate acyltransferase
MAGYGRRIHFLQAREQFEIVVVRHFFRLLGCIPVARGAADISAIRQALQRLEQGAAIGVFPEGDVEKPDDQRPGAGHGGAALLALRGGAAIVPAFIQGPQARGIISDWFRFNRGVRITFGHPIPLDRYRKLPLTRDRLREVTDLLMQKIEELRPHPGSAAKPN